MTEHIPDIEQPLVTYLQTAWGVLQAGHSKLSGVTREHLCELIDTSLAALEHIAVNMLPDDQLDDGEEMDPDYVAASNVVYALAYLVRDLVPEVPDAGVAW